MAQPPTWPDSIPVMSAAVSTTAGIDQKNPPLTARYRLAVDQVFRFWCERTMQGNDIRLGMLDSTTLIFLLQKQTESPSLAFPRTLHTPSLSLRLDCYLLLTVVFAVRGCAFEKTILPSKAFWGLIFMGRRSELSELGI